MTTDKQFRTAINLAKVYCQTRYQGKWTKDNIIEGLDRLLKHLGDGPDSPTDEKLPNPREPSLLTTDKDKVLAAAKRTKARLKATNKRNNWPWGLVLFTIDVFIQELERDE